MMMMPTITPMMNLPIARQLGGRPVQRPIVP
jgi:hypothetical protein